MYRKFSINPSIECSIVRFSKKELEIVPNNHMFSTCLPKNCILNDAVCGANHLITKTAEGKRKVLMKFAKTYLEGVQGFALHAIEAGKPKLFYLLGENTFLPANISEVGFFASGKEIYTFDNEMLYVHRYKLAEPLEKDVLYAPIINAGNQLGMLIAEGEKGKRMKFKCCGSCGPINAEHEVSIFLEYVSQIGTIFSNLMSGWFDQKTGLLNAAAFEGEIYPSMKRWVQKGKKFSLLFLDLDRFKAINDNYGHLAGDEVLRATAKVLVESTKSTSSSRKRVFDYPDLAIRWGGDEFLVVLQNMGAKAAAQIAKRIIKELSFIGYWNHMVSASVGITDSTEMDVTAADGMRLIDKADKFHYQAKERGKETGSTGWLAYLDTAVGRTIIERYKPLPEDIHK